MSIFSYLFENNSHQATFSTLPVIVGSSRLHENQIKVRFFRPGRLASGEKSKRRIYLQQEPSSSPAQDTSWAKTRLGMGGLGLRLGGGGLSPPKPNPGYVSADSRCGRYLVAYTVVNSMAAVAPRGSVSRMLHTHTAGP